MPAVSYLSQYRIFYGFLSRVKQGSIDHNHQNIHFLVIITTNYI